jgi:outer membrane protein insertion porin family
VTGRARSVGATSALFGAALAVTLLSGSLCAQPATTPVVRGSAAVPAEQLALLFAMLPRDAALDSAHALYASAGYLSPTIDAVGDTITIDEGRRYHFASVTITPDSLSALARTGGFDESPYVGNPFSPGRANELLDAIVVAFGARGYPLAVARISDFVIDDSAATVAAQIAVDAGDRVVVTEIDVEGNTETDRGLIIAAAALRRGTPFNDELARQVRARLERLDLFAEVGEPQLYRTDSGGYGILVRVTEGSPNTFDGILGYQPPESIGAQGSLTGHLNVVLRNLFGTGRRVAVRFERSKPSQLLEVRYGEPYLFRLPLDIELGFRQRQEIASISLPSYVQRSLTVDASYGFLDAWSVRAGGAFEETLPELDTLRSCASQLLNSSVLQTSLGVVFDTRNSPINPTSGASFATSVAVGSKSIRNTSVCFDSTRSPSEFRQRIVVDLDAFMSLGGPFVVAAGVHGGEIRGNFLEESDLFRVGGQSTVRGYREDEFRASRRAWGNLEARVLLSRTSYAGLFLDGGYALRPDDPVRGTTAVEYWLLGYGVAAQVETPLGLIRFSYALGRDDTFETGKVFVGLVNRF